MEASTQAGHVTGHTDRWAFLLLATATFVYLAFRAAMVPWVHDESASLYWYLEREQWLPYVALWDAGNHFLSSAIGVLGHKLWGLSLLGSRVGSLLAFPVFAWAVFRLGAFINDRGLRRALWGALLLCPLLLDFFALFRGYGPGMAWWAVALVAGLHHASDQRPRHLVLMLGALALANFSVLALVPLWALIVVALGADLLGRTRSGGDVRTSWAAWLLLGVLPLLLGLLLAWEMRRRGLLYHGSTDGFIPVTLTSLCRYVLGSTHGVVLALVGAATLGATAIAVRARQWRGPLALLLALLWADVLLRTGMALLLGVNHAEDRTALHLVVLFLPIVALAADALPAAWATGRKVAVAALLFLPVRTVWTANLDHTLLWPEQSGPTRFLEHIAKLQRGTQRPLIIGTYNQLDMALPYAARLHGLSLNPPEVDGFPDGPHDVRIVDERFLEQAAAGWEQLDHAPGPGLYLLKPERRLRTAIYQRTTFEAPVAGQLEAEVWRDDERSQGRETLVQLRAHISSPERFLDLRLVVEGTGNDTLVYRRIRPLPLVRAHWQGEELHWVVRVPPMPAAEQRRVYFSNPLGQAVTIIPGEVKLHRTNVLPSH